MLSSAQKASSLIKNILDVVKETAAQDKLIEIGNIIITLQEKNASLREKNADLVEIKQKLEAKLMQYEKWDHIKKKYVLTELAPGVFVYAPNPDVQTAEPRHYICANCFKKKHESILQYAGMKPSGMCYHCSECNCDIIDHTQAIDLDPPCY